MQDLGREEYVWDDTAGIEVCPYGTKKYIMNSNSATEVVQEVKTPLASVVLYFW